ncbi:hypothetical protein K491DRAFT_690199 [Lophiostoma macrostomum CBS 122681]|uniref:Uncharacterized protein n=1 Tax=Lophiostoma macrostomum CBS 122681 TaxID=1314788 RepID=A0A6A6TGK1_9PLEO|nr:hypothetical protein K491DRAFT_690199 [Lophiostoma macrostomum CBS 122681]
MREDSPDPDPVQTLSTQQSQDAEEPTPVPQTDSAGGLADDLGIPPPPDTMVDDTPIAAAAAPTSTSGIPPGGIADAGGEPPVPSALATPSLAAGVIGAAPAPGGAMTGFVWPTRNTEDIASASVTGTPLSSGDSDFVLDPATLSPTTIPTPDSSSIVVPVVPVATTSSPDASSPPGISDAEPTSVVVPVIAVPSADSDTVLTGTELQVPGPSDTTTPDVPQSAPDNILTSTPLVDEFTTSTPVIATTSAGITPPADDLLFPGSSSIAVQYDQVDDVPHLVGEDASLPATDVPTRLILTPPAAPPTVSAEPVVSSLTYSHFPPGLEPVGTSSPVITSTPVAPIPILSESASASLEILVNPLRPATDADASDIVPSAATTDDVMNPTDDPDSLLDVLPLPGEFDSAIRNSEPTPSAALVHRPVAAPLELTPSAFRKHKTIPPQPIRPTAVPLRPAPSAIKKHQTQPPRPTLPIGALRQDNGQSDEVPNDSDPTSTSLPAGASSDDDAAVDPTDSTDPPVADDPNTFPLDSSAWVYPASTDEPAASEDTDTPVPGPDKQSHPVMPADSSESEQPTACTAADPVTVYVTPDAAWFRLHTPPPSVARVADTDALDGCEAAVWNCGGCVSPNRCVKINACTRSCTRLPYLRTPDDAPVTEATAVSTVRGSRDGDIRRQDSPIAKQDSDLVDDVDSSSRKYVAKRDVVEDEDIDPNDSYNPDDPTWADDDAADPVTGIPSWLADKLEELGTMSSELISNDTDTPEQVAEEESTPTDDSSDTSSEPSDDSPTGTISDDDNATASTTPDTDINSTPEPPTKRQFTSLGLGLDDGVKDPDPVSPLFGSWHWHAAPNWADQRPSASASAPASASTSTGLGVNAGWAPILRPWSRPSATGSGFGTGLKAGAKPWPVPTGVGIPVGAGDAAEIAEAEVEAEVKAYEAVVDALSKGAPFLNSSSSSSSSSPSLEVGGGVVYVPTQAQAQPDVSTPVPDPTDAEPEPETTNLATNFLPLFMGHGPVVPEGVTWKWPTPTGLILSGGSGSGSGNGDGDGNLENMPQVLPDSGAGDDDAEEDGDADTGSGPATGKDTAGLSNSETETQTQTEMLDQPDQPKAYDIAVLDIPSGEQDVSDTTTSQQDTSEQPDEATGLEAPAQDSSTPTVDEGVAPLASSTDASAQTSTLDVSDTASGKQRVRRWWVW